jgi:hypothetical protein
MIFQIIFAIIFFSLGIWRGYIKSQEHFGKMMEQGKVMYYSKEFGWLGHPDAFIEIRNQKDDLDADGAALITRVAKKAVRRIRKDKGIKCPKRKK